MPRKVDISYKTVVFTVLFLLSLWVIYQVRDILFSLFIAFIFMSALHPTVDRMEKMKIPRPLTVVIIYLLFFGFIGLVAAGLIPALIEQTSALIAHLPDYLDQVRLPLVNREAIEAQLSQLGSLPQGILKFTVSAFYNLVGIFTLAVITFYMLMERKNLPTYLTSLFNRSARQRAIAFIERVEDALGRWVRAEILLMTIIGLMSYVGLTLLQIDFALPLAVLAALLEVIPNIGPTVSAVPAIIAGLIISPLTGLAAAALCFFIQQLENSFIVPKVMEKGLDINPLVVIICLAIGLKLGNIEGMILAIPIFLVIREAVVEFTQSDEK